MNDSLALRARRARHEIGRSVVSVRPPRSEGDRSIPFGVKDTRSMPREIVERLEATGRYFWLTVDKMADKGRSVDTELTNPITYRLMTGSTSGGPINILKGLTEYALGTDGGGSVLGPAAATNLVSFIGAGLDMLACSASPSLSTDGVSYIPSVGIIGKTVLGVRDCLAAARGVSLDPCITSAARDSFRIALPRPGDVCLPDGIDMRKKLDVYLSRLGPAFEYEEFDLSGSENRVVGIARLKAAFEDGIDVVLTAEGPVDVFGYDETILRSFSGSVGASLTRNGGKYLIKAANMARASALTVPTDEPASTILVCARPGARGARIAFEIATILESALPPAPLFKRYFLDQEKWNEHQAFDAEEVKVL